MLQNDLAALSSANSGSQLLRQPFFQLQDLLKLSALYL